MKNFKIGLEIESALNGNFHNIRVGSAANKLKYWNTKYDGSLRNSNKFPISNLVEFVSIPLKTEKTYYLALKQFKTYITKKEKYLNNVIDFNSSCGCHVHFSFKDFNFADNVYYTIFIKIRKFFFDKIKLSNISSKEEILKHYFRGYSKRFQKSHIQNPTKYREFNFYSERQGRGLEWRSPNMLNIKTWAEFDEFFKILYESIEFAYNICRKYQINFKHKFDVRNIFNDDNKININRVESQVISINNKITRKNVINTENINKHTLISTITVGRGK